MLEECLQDNWLCWWGEINPATVLSSVIAATTAGIILVTALVASKQLHDYKATRIGEILHRFSEDVYQHENVRNLLVQIIQGKKLDIGVSKRGLLLRASLAQLLDALCAVAVEVQHDQITLRDVAHSSVGYVAARTYSNLSVSLYLASIRSEHREMNLPEVGFGPFIWLADQLSTYSDAREGHALRL